MVQGQPRCSIRFQPLRNRLGSKLRPSAPMTAMGRIRRLDYNSVNDCFWRLAPVRCEAAIRPKAGPKQKCLSHARIDVNDPKATLGEGVNSTRVKLGRAFGLPTTIFVILESHNFHRRPTQIDSVATLGAPGFDDLWISPTSLQDVLFAMLG